MKSKQWDGLVDRMEQRLAECRAKGMDDALTAWALSHTACAYLEAIDPKGLTYAR